MGKSVYSVILTDELVDELDRAAYEKGVSRSFMLDRILADYLTVETPALRMENIFAKMQRVIDEWSGLRFNQPSASTAYVQSALVYRYNPTVKYSIELFRSGDDLGAVRMSMRTQNPTLIALLEDFFKFFRALESKYLGEREYSYEDLRFTRILKKPSGLTAEEVGEAIAYFVRSVNYMLNGYFSGLGDLPVTLKRLETVYMTEISKKIKV